MERSITIAISWKKLTDKPIFCWGRQVVLLFGKQLKRGPCGWWWRDGSHRSVGPTVSWMQVISIWWARWRWWQPSAAPSGHRLDSTSLSQSASSSCITTSPSKAPKSWSQLTGGALQSNRRWHEMAHNNSNNGHKREKCEMHHVLWKVHCCMWASVWLCWWLVDFSEMGVIVGSCTEVVHTKAAGSIICWFVWFSGICKQC